MIGYQFLGDSQTNAGTALFGGEVGVENLGKQFRGNALTGIADTQFDLRATLQISRRYLQTATMLHGLHGIKQHIHDHLLQPVHITYASETPTPEPETPQADPPGKLAQPRGLAVNKDGNVLVCDFGNNRIQEFAPDLHFLDGWGTFGKSPGEFKQPCGIAIAPSGEIFVADTWNQRVQVFSKTGQFVRQWSAAFYGPRGIAVDAKGSVFVADTGNNRVVRFSADGNKEVEWGGKGPEPGHFIEPVGVVVGSGEQVYVCDNGNSRLQMFSRDGKFIKAFAVPGWEVKPYSEPNITLDPHGTIWVTVPAVKEIRAYDKAGTLRRTITGSSIKGVSFDTPLGISYSPATKELIISDLENRLVRIPVAGK